MRIPIIHRDSTSEADGPSCHGGPQADIAGLPLLAIVGCPNVGKSVLFNVLTGAYVTVSNYPGTTVEVSRGKGRLDGYEVGVVDTPGMYRLLPITEEERVARQILLHERPAAVIHVTDAKNLERMLPMTLQLIEAGVPIILDVNFMDEAERLGLQVDVVGLERALGVPVVATTLARGKGTTQLKETLVAHVRGHCTDCPSPASRPAVQYHPAIEAALEDIETRLGGAYRLSKRMVALLLLQNDDEVVSLVREQDGRSADEILQIAEATRAKFGQPISCVVAHRQHEAAKRILRSVLIAPEQRLSGFAERLSEVMMNPLTGIPLLLLALFLLYQFVGVLGAQTLVGFLEDDVFGTYINPWVNATLATFVPWPVIRDLIGGDYGVITLGVRYAVAIILPIVGTFFIAFSIIEDSGYLPRLAMLIDRVFKRIGLNGRAVIPMTLGFGCDTMATIVTRTLETRRERIISTLLLALAIPCSAQLGVLMGLLGSQPNLFVLWAMVVAAVFLLVGFLAACVMPGERPTFYMEVPPLRVPTLGNVLVKTYTRMEWYFREVFPLFIIASVLIWLGRLTGLFDLAVSSLVPLMRWMGLPDQAAVAFLFGFFRRDYGAAGLYDLRSTMTGTQLLIAATTMTLFVPCIAQFSVTLKERGWKTALAIEAFIFPFAFLVGGLLGRLLTALGVIL
ncbi:MAG: ferrous iron transport protein B [Chloroflexi bacterium]|nr:ferrous iron transport protein B [Chloroflexota bacterium]MCL5110727.1 ferrous iron transport protein B [Chloroflexota bacterium]